MAAQCEATLNYGRTVRCMYDVGHTGQHSNWDRGKVSWTNNSDASPKPTETKGITFEPAPEGETYYLGEGLLKCCKRYVATELNLRRQLNEFVCAEGTVLRCNKCMGALQLGADKTWIWRDGVKKAKS